MTYGILDQFETNIASILFHNIELIFSSLFQLSKIHEKKLTLILNSKTVFQPTWPLFAKICHCADMETRF